MDINSDNMSLLMEKKQQLENIIKESLRGHMVRSRVDYLNESEKPTKYFCQLEKNNYQTKTIKRLQISNGDILQDQHRILDIY